MKALDLFGSQILLRFQGKQSHKTSFGSFFSLVIVGIIGIRLTFIISEAWHRKTPTVLYSERNVISPEKFDFSFPTSRFAFGLQDPEYAQHYIDPSVYSVIVIKTKRIKFFNETSQEKEVRFEEEQLFPVPCTRENFSDMENPEFFLRLNYEHLYCFDKSDYFSIEGDFTSDVFQYATFTVKRCEGITCADSAKIDSLLYSGFFSIYFTDTLVDPEDKDEPFKVYTRDLYWIINQKFPKNVNCYYRNTYIQSDFGWVYEEINQKQFAQFNMQEITKHKENLHKRKYKNINTIISEIGGFTQTLLALGYFLCTRLSQLDLNKDIINSAFNFENTSHSSQSSLSDQQKDSSKPPREKKYNNSDFRVRKSSNFKSGSPQYTTTTQPQIKLQNGGPASPVIASLKSKPDQKLSSMMLSSVIRQKKGTNVNANNSFRKISSLGGVGQNPISNPEPEPVSPNISDSLFKKMMNQFRGSMELNVWEYVKFFVWPFGKIKEKKQIIDYSIDKLYYHLDVLNVVKKLLEIEKLKRLIMDDDQLKLFELLPKPLIRTSDVIDGNRNRPQTEAEVEVQECEAPTNRAACPNDLLYQDTRSELEKVRQAYTSFVKIKQKSSREPLEDKLLNLMDKNILSLFSVELNEDNDECQEIQISINHQNNPISPSQFYLNKQGFQLELQQFSGGNPRDHFGILQVKSDKLVDSPKQESPQNSLNQQSSEIIESKYQFFDSLKQNNRQQEREEEQDIDIEDSEVKNVSHDQSSISCGFAAEKGIQFQIPSEESCQSRNHIKTKHFPLKFFR